MFRGWFVVSAMLVFFASTAVLGLLAMFRAKAIAARMDAGAAAVLAVVMATVALGRAPAAAIPLALVLASVFAWFAVGAVHRKGGPEGPARFTAIHGAAVTALTGWVLFFAARGFGSVSDHPGHQLGLIIIDLGGAVLMVFAAASWLLGTFATPAESKSLAVPRLTGIREALMTAGLAVAFYAIS